MREIQPAFDAVRAHLGQAHAPTRKNGLLAFGRKPVLARVHVEQRRARNSKTARRWVRLGAERALKDPSPRSRGRP